MALTQKKIRDILTSRLDLQDPEFHLEKAGSRISGCIISKTFYGQEDDKRQESIWNALETELGGEALTGIGLLLAYTPDEWKLPTGR